MCRVSGPAARRDKGNGVILNYRLRAGNMLPSDTDINPLPPQEQTGRYLITYVFQYPRSVSQVPLARTGPVVVQGTFFPMRRDRSGGQPTDLIGIVEL